MLHGMQCENLKYKFYESKISLADLLSINYKRLEEIGIEYPFQRKRVLHGLLRVHEQPWSRESLCLSTKNSNRIENYFDVYANCLKQLIVIKSTMAFIRNNDFLADFKDVNEQTLHYRHDIEKILLTIQYKAEIQLKILKMV